MKYSEMFGALFFFADISILINDQMLDLFLKDTALKALQNPYKKFPLRNKKIFQIFSASWEITLPRESFILNIENHSNNSIRISLRTFCRAFHDASFKQHSRLYHLYQLRYMRNKKRRKTSLTSGITITISFSVKNPQKLK